MTVDTSPEAIAALLDGVTEGPWEWDEWCSDLSPLWTVEMSQGAGYIDWSVNKESHARFILAARQLVPALAAENAALKAEDARLREALEPFCGWTIGGVIADSPENAAKYPLLAEQIGNARAALKGQTDEQ